jgi:hypothetical protein
MSLFGSVAPAQAGEAGKGGQPALQQAMGSLLGSPAGLGQLGQTLAPTIKQLLQPVLDAQASIQKNVAAVQTGQVELQNNMKKVVEQVAQILENLSAPAAASENAATEAPSENAAAAGGGRKKSRSIARGRRRAKRTRRNA